MKAFLIKTDDRTIEAVEFKGTLEHAYELLGVTIIEAVDLGKGEAVYVDEEGLLNNETMAKGFFVVNGYPQQLAGRGLVVRTDDAGDWTDTRLTAEQLGQMIVFY